MKVVVEFDGRSFVPKGNVQLPVGFETEVEVPGRPTFDQWLSDIQKRGPLPYVDLENLDRGELYP